MSDLAIRVDRLSKQYRLGTAQPRYRTLRDVVADAFASRFRRPLGPVTGTPDARRRPDEPFRALDDVSLEVRHGEVLGVIGRNGAGKSTLLKILSRITEPDSGSVEIYGRVASLLEVGTGFHSELTGRENLFLSGAILGMKRAEITRKFDEIVAFAEVERFIDTPVKHYSSGMYLRLAFAVAAHLEPEILLIDEVLAVGDASFQNKCVGKMSETAKQGRTVLFVSHNMAAITQLCEKVVWLERGRVQKVDAPDDVVKAYLSHGNAQIVERQWQYPGDAPGDDRVRLLAVRVLQQGHRVSVIDINAPSTVEFEFAVLKPARNLVTGIHVANATGVCLFASRDWRPNQLAPGRYRKHVDIPAQLLAETRLSVDVGLVFYDPDVPSVQISALVVDTIDSAHPLAVRGPYKGKWPGLLRVRLPWSEAAAID
jgi:lipopolysaccharide transport system ATP-binding protein